jgi:thiol-disulfide isomerase/thioredoxin
MRCLPLAACLLVALAGAEVKDDAPAPPTGPEANADITVQVVDYDGVMEVVASHKGKVVVMDAWSTWCEPCVKEFPGLVELHKKYGADKVACVSLSFDFSGDEDEKPEDYTADVLAFLKEQGATFDNLLASDPDDLYDRMRFPSVPAVFVFDVNGKLAQRVDNSKRGSTPFTYADVEKVVAGLLDEQAP